MAATATARSQEVRDQDGITEFADAWELFFAAVRRARGRAGSEAGETLTLSQYYLLAPLGAGGSRPVGVLADAAGIAQPTATRMLATLERNELVTRASSPDDGRVVSVSLTEEGRRAWETKHARLERQRGAVFASLDDDERARGAAMLLRLAQVVDRF
jgi:DNA-binding MarR family transcriptional regulator